MPDGMNGKSLHRKVGGIAQDRLLSIVERYERLDEEIKALRGDQKDIMIEAQSAGFDPKVVRQMVKERRFSHDELQEWTALCELYRAALGMLDGTPLGDAARRRLESPPPASSSPSRQQPPVEPDPFAFAPDNREEEAPVALPPGPADIAAAREQGRLDSEAGKSVMANPWPSGDPRRASWDEGWCSCAGSDGMDIPAAWRRSKPKKGDEKGAPG